MKRWLVGWLYKQLTTNKTRFVVVVVIVVAWHSSTLTQIEHHFVVACFVVTLLSWIDHETLPFHPPKKRRKKISFWCHEWHQIQYGNANINYEHISRLWKFELLLHIISQHGNAQNVPKLSIGWDTI
jgi:hypothetical protein